MTVDQIFETSHSSSEKDMLVKVDLWVNQEEYEVLCMGTRYPGYGTIDILPSRILLENIEKKKNEELEKKLKAARELLKEHGEL